MLGSLRCTTHRLQRGVGKSHKYFVDVFVRKNEMDLLEVVQLRGCNACDTGLHAGAENTRFWLSLPGDTGCYVLKVIRCIFFGFACACSHEFMEFSHKYVRTVTWTETL